MDLIVAVYDDWGIGRDGTQPIALSADRRFFRQRTQGCMVIAGRRTAEDFRRPLPGRVNVVLTRGTWDRPGFTVCHSPREALALAAQADRAMVIGGGSVYRQLLPWCETAYVTKVHATPVSDTFFPNLDEDEAWYPAQTLAQGEEGGVAYEMVAYRRKAAAQEGCHQR